MKSKITKKTVIEHLEELIEFYSNYQTSDKQFKKLIIGSLKAVKRRAEAEKETKDGNIKDNS